MQTQVLVTYAGKYGATAEIAERIGEVLNKGGVSADVLPVGVISDLTPYTAVVLGSALYAGQWRKEAATFLQACETELSGRSLWIFSSGPTGEGDPVTLMKGFRLPAAQQAIADRIGARDVTLFHGAMDATNLNLIEKLLIKMVKAPAGDFRDWDAIAAWAATIAEALKG